MVDANNNMQGVGNLEGAGTKNLQTSEMTLFFPTGADHILRGSLESTRLINFLEYPSRESPGCRVLLLLIGSASAPGTPQRNERLSRERATAPEPIIDQYLVNIPHQLFKVYGRGDIYSPKPATLSQAQRYQNVRIIAASQTDQVPVVPTASKS
jgi:hypothetical protein